MHCCKVGCSLVITEVRSKYTFSGAFSPQELACSTWRAYSCHCPKPFLNCVSWVFSSSNTWVVCLRSSWDLFFIEVCFVFSKGHSYFQFKVCPFGSPLWPTSSFLNWVTFTVHSLKGLYSIKKKKKNSSGIRYRLCDGIPNHYYHELGHRKRIYFWICNLIKYCLCSSVGKYNGYFFLLAINYDKSSSLEKMKGIKVNHFWENDHD